VTSSRGSEEFDHVIFATHADTSLQLLGRDASELEREILGSFEFSNNVATLHSDLDVIPLEQLPPTPWAFPRFQEVVYFPDIFIVGNRGCILDMFCWL
jgi:uncharacterized protein